MSASEFDFWNEEYQREPWGDRRADLRAAIGTSANVNLWQGKNAKRAKPLDFMPFLTDEERASADESEVDMTPEGIAKMFGAIGHATKKPS